MTEQKDKVIFQGVSCPKQSPWPSWVDKITGIPFLVIVLLGAGILYKTDIPALILWLIIFGIFLIPLRFLVCARCPYYGQHCSTTMGKVVPLIFKKQEGKSILIGLWLDVMAFVVLFSLPLAFAYQLGGWILVMLWCLTFFFTFVILTGIGCSHCPFTFCPIGKAGNAFWSFFGKKFNKR